MAKRLYKIAAVCEAAKSPTGKAQPSTTGTCACTKFSAKDNISRLKSDLPVSQPDKNTRRGKRSVATNTLAKSWALVFCSWPSSFSNKNTGSLFAGSSACPLIWITSGACSISVKRSSKPCKEPLSSTCKTSGFFSVALRILASSASKSKLGVRLIGELAINSSCNWR